MKYVLILIAIAAVVYVAYQAVRVRGLMYVGEKLGQSEQAFTRTSGSVSMLVLGDSTAVGLGTTDPQYTVAGRLAQLLDASVENRAVSGAVTADAGVQIAEATGKQYDLILIQVGANDIIRFHSVKKTASELDALLIKAAALSERIVLLTAGKVGEAPFFPQTIGFLWTNRAAQLRESFMSVAEKHNVAYVDLFAIPDPFSQNPDAYYAPDGLHLSDGGYGFWYEQVQKTVQKRWPDLGMHGQ